MIRTLPFPKRSGTHGRNPRIKPGMKPGRSALAGAHPSASVPVIVAHANGTHREKSSPMTMKGITICSLTAALREASDLLKKSRILLKSLRMKTVSAESSGRQIVYASAEASFFSCITRNIPRMRSQLKPVFLKRQFIAGSRRSCWIFRRTGTSTNESRPKKLLNFFQKSDSNQISNSLRK